MGTVAIVGGGAAGLVAAIEAARTDAHVELFEANDRVGKTILATGNGRCNFSHAAIDASCYRNASFVQDALTEERAAYAARLKRGLRDIEEPHEIADFFGRLGMLWREEEGRLYPLTNKASTVVDVLRQALASWGVREGCGRRVTSLRPREGGGFSLAFADGASQDADAVVLACGGHIARDVVPTGHRFVERTPVLGPLRTDTKAIHGLNNVRVRCDVALRGPDGREKTRASGEILFRDYGVSGIAAFDLSRFAQPGDRVTFDFVPWVRAVDFEAFCFRRLKRQGSVRGPAGVAPTLLDFVNGIVLPQVGRCVLRAAGLDPAAPATKADIPAVAAALKGFAVEVRGVGDARQCQVTRGGLDVRDFDARTLESRIMPGLYAAGEALDVDGPCGGFNLHWAWASGLLAGRSAGESVCWEGKDA